MASLSYWTADRVVGVLATLIVLSVLAMWRWRNARRRVLMGRAWVAEAEEAVGAPPVSPSAPPS